MVRFLKKPKARSLFVSGRFVFQASNAFSVSVLLTRFMGVRDDLVRYAGCGSRSVFLPWPDFSRSLSSAPTAASGSPTAASFFLDELATRREADGEIAVALRSMAETCREMNAALLNGKSAGRLGAPFLDWHLGRTLGLVSDWARLFSSSSLSSDESAVLASVRSVVLRLPELYEAHLRVMRSGDFEELCAAVDSVRIISLGVERPSSPSFSVLSEDEVLDRVRSFYGLTPPSGEADFSAVSEEESDDRAVRDLLRKPLFSFGELMALIFLVPAIAIGIMLFLDLSKSDVGKVRSSQELVLSSATNVRTAFVSRNDYPEFRPPRSESAENRAPGDRFPLGAAPSR
jgi:hypothetical protein